MRQRSRWARAILVLLAAGAAGACYHRSPPAAVVSIPRAPGPIKIDGKCCEDWGWQGAFRSPLFEDAYGHTAPYTELRATADDDNLYFEVYVADADIRSQDLIKLMVGPLLVELTPKGANAPPGVRTAVGCDDTIDDPSHNDEEWVNEIAIPWALLGSREVAVRALRVDVGVGGPPHALAWPRSAPAILKFDSKVTAALR